MSHIPNANKGANVGVKALYFVVAALVAALYHFLLGLDLKSRLGYIGQLILLDTALELDGLKNVDGLLKYLTNYKVIYRILFSKCSPSFSLHLLVLLQD